MSTLADAPSIILPRRRVPAALIALLVVVALLLVGVLVRNGPWRDPLRVPDGWTGDDLWAEFDLRLEDGRPLRSGDQIPVGTRVTLARRGTQARAASPKPAAHPAGSSLPTPRAPGSSSGKLPTGTQAPEAPLQLLCFGEFAIDAWMVTVEPHERVRLAGGRGWSLGGLDEGSIVTFHAEGPHSLVLASYTDRRYATTRLEITVVAAPDPADPAGQ